MTSTTKRKGVGGKERKGEKLERKKKPWRLLNESVIYFHNRIMFVLKYFVYFPSPFESSSNSINNFNNNVITNSIRRKPHPHPF